MSTEINNTTTKDVLVSRNSSVVVINNDQHEDKVIDLMEILQQSYNRIGMLKGFKNIHADSSFNHIKNLFDEASDIFEQKTKTIMDLHERINGFQSYQSSTDQDIAKAVGDLAFIAKQLRQKGHYPYFISKEIALILYFRQGCLSETKTKTSDLAETIITESKLTLEPEIIQCIKVHYCKYIDRNYVEDIERVWAMKAAYSEGFKTERQYKGCAQCMLYALSKLAGKEMRDIFRAASGFSGGMAISGDGVCGGYSGGLMFMGTYAGRRWDLIANDKEEQYKSYEMAQRLHDKFIDTYGSVICSDIHEKVFGIAYCLRTKEVRDEFEKAGAHVDKCTSVIANAAAWVTDILIEEDIL